MARATPTTTTRMELTTVTPAEEACLIGHMQDKVIQATTMVRATQITMPKVLPSTVQATICLLGLMQDKGVQAIATALATPTITLVTPVLLVKAILATTGQATPTTTPRLLTPNTAAVINKGATCLLGHMPARVTQETTTAQAIPTTIPVPHNTEIRTYLHGHRVGKLHSMAPATPTTTLAGTTMAAVTAAARCLYGHKLDMVTKATSATKDQATRTTTPSKDTEDKCLADQNGRLLFYSCRTKVYF